MAEELPTPKDLYAFAFDHVKHENSLVNNRTTWFVQFTVFLLTAYSIIAQALVKYDVPPGQEGPHHALVLSGGAVLALTLVIAGLFACYSTYNAVTAAFHAMNAVERHWDDRCKAREIAPEAFPSLLGGGVKTARDNGARLGVLLPQVMGALWVVLGAMPLWLLIALRR